MGPQFYGTTGQSQPGLSLLSPFNMYCMGGSCRRKLDSATENVPARPNVVEVHMHCMMHVPSAVG
jgi:hypothetical protein